ncbi:CHAD domain-containing protein [Trinickia diaoshuihuensis]|uniref:CHAD domain-containing protein n=1 Tax=Trinickia diaoshuihuensis TaxID=2292265 RepID=UPI000E23DD8E|nr:CHAD domain-containing protein [Trinickia diaoshuihuensis]
MPDTVELVLALEAIAAREWMEGPAQADDAGPAKRRTAPVASRNTSAPSAARKRAARTSVRPRARDDAGTAIADALGRMPGIEPIGAVERSTVRLFVERDGASRVALAASDDGTRRIRAARAHALSPGVWRCETLCDEPLEAGVALALGDAFPQAVEDALGKPGKFAPSPALTVRHGTWRWSGPDGAVVDIELSDARSLFDSIDSATSARADPEQGVQPGAADSHEPGHSPIAFCELRLVSRIEPEPQPQLRSSELAAIALDARTTDPDTVELEPRDTEEKNSSPRYRQAHSEATAVRALFAAAGALADALPVFPVLEAGYERACAADLNREPTRATRTNLSNVGTPHGALSAVAAGVARQWFGNEAGVRDGIGTETEFVHQMRVALRRLKTLLKTFPKWADERWERTIAPELDWLGGLLGRARDLDVFVDATLPALAAADVDRDTWTSLQARAAVRRHEAREQVRAALRSRRYAALSLAWLQWLAAQRYGAGPAELADKPLARYAAKRVRKHYARLIAKPALTALTPAERHRRRIEAKRLRYTLEFFESLTSHKTRRKLSKQLGRIQSILGDGSDATAALRFLEALDVPPYVHGFARGWCEAVNRWSAIEGERLLRELGKPKIVRES